MRTHSSVFSLLAASCALAALSSVAAAETIRTGRGTVEINGVAIACSALSQELRGQFTSCLMPDEDGDVAALPASADVIEPGIRPGTGPTAPNPPVVAGPNVPTDPSDSDAGCNGALCVGIGGSEQVPLVSAGLGDDSNAQLVSGSVAGGDDSGQAEIVGAAVAGGDDAGTGLVGASVMSGADSGVGTVAGIAAASGDGSGTGIVGASAFSGEQSGTGSLAGVSAFSAAGSGNGEVLGASVLDDDGTQVYIDGQPVILAPDLSTADLNAAVLGATNGIAGAVNDTSDSLASSGGTNLTLGTDGSLNLSGSGDGSTSLGGTASALDGAATGLGGVVSGVGDTVSGVGQEVGDNLVGNTVEGVGDAVRGVGDAVGGLLH